MTSPPPERSVPAAWQPFTWGGVAAFARASAWRVVVAAGLTALVLGWVAEQFATSAWLPVVNRAVASLPATGEIRDGRLRWPTNTVTPLGESTFVTVLVNPTASLVEGQTADVRVEIGPSAVQVGSLFGYLTVAYPGGLLVPLNRPAVEPVWLAWRPYLRAGLLLGVAAAVSLSWLICAMLAAPVLRLLAAGLRRQVSGWGCGKLAVAAMLPGGLLIAASLLLYANRGFRLLDFILAFALAHLLDALLMLGAVFALPRKVPVSPFAEAEVPATVAEATAPATAAGAKSAVDLERSPFAAPKPARSANPFASAAEQSETISPPAPPPPAPPAQPPSHEEPLNPS